MRCCRRSADARDGAGLTLGSSALSSGGASSSAARPSAPTVGTGGAASGGGGFGGGGFGGGGFGGGFSFPVTPPTADEPDQRLFTSWPSVRSSCTSEPVAMSDDDNALPAEYADDGEPSGVWTCVQHGLGTVKIRLAALSGGMAQRGPCFSDGYNWPYAQSASAVRASVLLLS